MEEAEAEFRLAWKVLPSMWLKKLNTVGKSLIDHSTAQLEVLQQFVLERACEFPLTSQLIQIMVSTSANTSPVERGYSHLEIICNKRRGNLDPKNIETLFVLSQICKIGYTLKNPWDYESALKCLEKK